jgi:hypothetical protein
VEVVEKEGDRVGRILSLIKVSLSGGERWPLVGRCEAVVGEAKDASVPTAGDWSGPPTTSDEC